MRALVTGGGGFIGTNLIKRLLEDGDSVVSFDNYSTGFTQNKQDGARYIETDIRDGFKNWIQKFDVIFHLAALPRIKPSFNNPSEVVDVNVKGTQNVLEYAKKTKTPVIYAGSSSFWGGVYKNPYTFSKWQGEELCKMYTKLFGLKTVILRYFNVYGERQPLKGQYAPVVGIFQRQVAAGEPMTIVGDGEQRRDFTYVKDVANANVLAMTSTNEEIFGEIFNVGTGTNISVLQLADLIGDETQHIPSRPGEAQTTLADISKITTMLGWSPTISIQEWLRDQ